MANGNVTANEPYVNFNFLVEVDGITRASFHECSAFNSSVEVIEYNEGGTLYPLRIPGRVKFANITLKRGMNADLDMYNWHLQVVQGTIQRRNGSIIMMDRANQNIVARWDFTQAWPTKCDGPGLNAEENSIAIDSFEIVCTTLKRVPVR